MQSIKIKLNCTKTLLKSLNAYLAKTILAYVIYIVLNWSVHTRCYIRKTNFRKLFLNIT